MRRLAGVAVALLLGLTACGSPLDSVTPGTDPPAPVPPNPTVTLTHTIDNSGVAPPPLRVRYGDTELLLDASTFCYSRGCVDGRDPDPPSVGSPEEIFVFVPVPRFTEFTVEQIAQPDATQPDATQPGEPDCAARRTDAEVEHLGAGWWRVRPRGPAGPYRFSLFAAGTGGDMVGELRWTTPYDRPLPDPAARLALIADHDGRPDSYGLEFIVTDLPAPPTEYGARITVTAANGQSRAIEATPAPEYCGGEGSVVFLGPDDEAKQAAALGDFPFTLRVELTLDGSTHVATATYPDDEIAGSEPYVAIEFTPPLPR